MDRTENIFSYSCYIAVTQLPWQIAQKAPLSAVLLLLCDISAVAELPLLRQHLATSFSF
jgi:hypothetical protein